VLFLALAAAVTALVLPQRRNSAGAAYRALLIVLVPTVLLQVQFGDVTSFFRYESWLVAIGLTGLAGGVAAFLRDSSGVLRRGPAGARAIAVTGVMAALLALLGLRAYRAAVWAPLASRTIYEQQYQMARFVHDYARGCGVALNDIGAVAFFGDAEVVDLAGLACLPVARATLARRADSRWLASYCAARGAWVAIVYEPWLGRRGGVPPGWRAVTRWIVRDNYAAGGDTVTVFSTEPRYDASVRAAVRAFEPGMPERVTRVTVSD
jgi:hypothetical protein